MDLTGHVLTDPPKVRRDWTTSRLVLLPSGPVPVLELLAREKFGTFDRRDLVAYWKDKNFRNERLENVGLTERGLLRRLPNPYGPHSRSAAYYRAYRKHNPLRRRVHIARYHAKIDGRVGALRTLLDIATEENQALHATLTGQHLPPAA